MYKYSRFDTDFVRQRNAQFRAQIERRLDGSLTEDEFKPLRLMNGLYLQLHAYMLRVAIPYGSLNGEQMRQLAMIAERWDKGYGHFTTRQNIQFNWPKLPNVADILDALGDVDMHAIQTSGNTIRNVTADHFAGAAADELEDPRPYAELIRQWSTDHPEFQFLPRKFKIALSGSPRDRAVTRAHDIGLRMVKKQNVVGFEVIVGGGLGRTPMIGKVIHEFITPADLLPYIEAIVSVWNLLGRCDNKYKARIKITVHEHGINKISALVEERFALLRDSFQGHDQGLLKQIRTGFAPPVFKTVPLKAFEQRYGFDRAFRDWVDTNTHPHHNTAYAIVSISLKTPGKTPGDASAGQMRVMAKIAERYGHNELRVSHEQNLILPHVPSWADPVWHLYVVRSKKRDALQEQLINAGIGSLIHYPIPPHMQDCHTALNLGSDSLPLARRLADEVLSLPMGPHLGMKGVDAVLEYLFSSHSKTQRFCSEMMRKLSVT